VRVTLLLAVCLAACAADPCARAEQTTVDFPPKIGGCQAIAPPVFDPTSCKASLKTCTPSDEAAITSYFDCLDQLPVCTVASDFTAAVLACANHLNALTPGCFAQP
jgi:hypothetical protein